MILKMMKDDITSVIGLKVEYDYGGAKPIIDTIADTRIREYKYVADGNEYVGKIYLISFSECPWSFYGVYGNCIKIIEGENL